MRSSEIRTSILQARKYNTDNDYVSAKSNFTSEMTVDTVRWTTPNVPVYTVSPGCHHFYYVLGQYIGQYRAEKWGGVIIDVIVSREIVTAN